VSLAIKLRIAPSVDGSIGTRRYAGQAAVVLEKLSEFIGVGAIVSDEAMVIAKSGRSCLAAVVSAHRPAKRRRATTCPRSSTAAVSFEFCPPWVSPMA
jgi:hypothetical protein